MKRLLEGLADLAVMTTSPPPDASQVDVLRPGFCQVINAHCGDLDCDRCPAFRRAMPDARFVCGTCVRHDEAIAPYWGDGTCQECGRETGWLFAATPTPGGTDGADLSR